jgi:GNAT superfamily N-acetyltransferase
MATDFLTLSPMQTGWARSGKATWVLVDDTAALAPAQADSKAAHPAGGSSVRGETILCNAEVFAHDMALHMQRASLEHAPAGNSSTSAASVVERGKCWLVSSVFTEPHQRGRGYATLMLRAILQEAVAAEGVLAACLFSDIGLFYSQFGFAAVAPNPQLDLVFPVAQHMVGATALAGAGQAGLGGAAAVAGSGSEQTCDGSATSSSDRDVIAGITARHALHWLSADSELPCPATLAAEGRAVFRLPWQAQPREGRHQNCTVEDQTLPRVSAAVIESSRGSGERCADAVNSPPAQRQVLRTLPTADRLRWHIQFSRLFCEEFGLDRLEHDGAMLVRIGTAGAPTHSGEGIQEPYIVFAIDPWSDRAEAAGAPELLILWLQCEDAGDAAALVAVAQRVARDAGLSAVRMWASGCLPCAELAARVAGARVEPRDGALPMVADLRAARLQAASAQAALAAAANTAGGPAEERSLPGCGAGTALPAAIAELHSTSPHAGASAKTPEPDAALETLAWDCIQRGIWN